MDLDEQTTDDCVVLPYSIYAAEDISGRELPSLCYTAEELGDTLLFAKLGSLQTMGLWDLEELGYTYDALIVRHDGKIEGAQQLPDYYAYSPDRTHTWEDGLQAIEDHDWSANKEEHKEEEVTNTSTMEATTDRSPEIAGLSFTKSDERNEFSRFPDSLKSRVQQEVIGQPRRDEVSSPPWIASLSKIREDDALFERKHAFEETVAVPASETEAARDAVSMTDEVLVQAEPTEATPTLISDPKHTVVSPGHEEFLHDSSVIGEREEPSGLDDIVTRFSALMSDSTGKPHGTAAFDDTLQNGVERAHSPESSQNLPVQPLKSLAPSIAESPPPASIIDEGLQCGSEAISADAILKDGFPGSSPSGEMTVKEAGEKATTPGPKEYAEDLTTEALEDNLSSETMPESIPIKTDKPEHEVIVQPEDSGTRGEQGRDLPPFAEMLEILSIPTGVETSTADDQHSAPEDSSVVADQLKRSRSPSMDASLNDEQETPAKKKIKASESVQPIALESELSCEDVDDTEVILPVVASKRPAPTEPPKETKAGNGKVPNTRRKSKITRKPPTKKTVAKEAVSKEPDIYFEEDIRPNEDGSTPALLRAQSDKEPSTISDEYEHLTDASGSPPQPTTSTPLRAPKNTVSNRELEALASTFTPGMHLGLHNHLNSMPTRFRKAREVTETPVKSSINGDLFMIDEGDTPEPEPSTKRRRTINKKTPAPKKAAPRRARGIKPEQGAAEISEEDEQELFPEPLIKPHKSLLAPALAPRKVVLKNTRPKKAGESTPLPDRRQTRSDAKPDTTPVTQSTNTTKRKLQKDAGGGDEDEDAKPNATSVTQSKAKSLLIKDADADKDEDAKPNTNSIFQSNDTAKPNLVDSGADESEYEASDPPSASPIPVPAPAPSKKKKTPARSALLKKVSAPSTAKSTPSLAGSTPARNIYGFSPRKTRSGNTPAASKTGGASKAKTAAAASKGKAAMGRSGEETPGPAASKAKGKAKALDALETGSARKTRKAAGLEAKEKDGNVGKRLRSKD